MAEYALVTAVMASLAVALTSIPEARLAARLPTTTARAAALVTETARTAKVLVAGARAAFASAPFNRPQLRYLYAAGWVGGRQRPAECAFAKVSVGSTAKRMAESIRKDGRLLARLRRMSVTVPAAADALTRGTAVAC
jgi:hypothetical protein